MTMEKVNITWAGIAGLSAGCYLQMNGYQTQIFETHSVAQPVKATVQNLGLLT
jgi:phytoene dehydrogenase-like protein